MHCISFPFVYQTKAIFLNSVQMLPTEILQIIFKDITVHDKKDLIQLQLTCKSWSVIARNLLYEAIALDTPLYDTSISTKKTKERERLLLRTLVAPGSSIRLLVKSLSMNVPDETSQSLGSCHLSAFIRLYPNLIKVPKCIDNILQKDKGIVQRRSSSTTEVYNNACIRFYELFSYGILQRCYT